MEERRGAEQEPAGVRGRALLIGSLGVAITALLVTQAELVLSSVRIGYLQLPPVALSLLLVVVLAGRGLRRLSARWGLSPSDLLIVYAMILVAAMVSSHGAAAKLVPLLVIPKYFQNRSNDWHGRFDPHIAPRLVPWDVRNGGKQPLVETYYNKLPRGAAIPWRVWVEPLLNWGFLVVLVLFAFLCLAAILRRQWVDNEKLAFPLAQLPLEIAGDEERHGFFTNRLMWLGALIPIAVYTVKGLHLLLPAVPDVPLSFPAGSLLVTPPWSAAADITVTLSFGALGFFFLLPAEVLFSLWFFFLVWHLLQVAAVAFNWDMTRMPEYAPPLFVGYQTVGGYLALVGYLFWLARPHLQHVWAVALGRRAADDAGELLPYRVAVWGLLGSVGGSGVWLWVNGMSLWLALYLLVVTIFVTGVVMARTTAEAGLLMTETSFSATAIYRLFAPLHALGPANLTLLAFFESLLHHDQRGLLLTGFLDGTRLADGTRVRRRAFAGAMVLGVGLALAVAVPLNIYLPYRIGANNMDSWLEWGATHWMFEASAQGFAPPAPQPAASMLACFALGAGITLLLTWMRATFFWWPLHPLGFVLMGTWSLIVFWAPCLLAWVLKALCLRYGGSAWYRRARPFFLGLVLGEFGMATLCVLVNIVFHIPPPSFPWG